MANYAKITSMKHQKGHLYTRESFMYQTLAQHQEHENHKSQPTKAHQISDLKRPQGKELFQDLKQFCAVNARA